MYPVDAVDWLDERGYVGRDIELVHQDFVGNYLELRYGTNAGVFFDDRFDLHSDELIGRYRTLASGTLGWDKDLDAAAAIVWERNTPVESLLRLSDGWTIAWQNDDWFIACHSSDARSRGTRLLVRLRRNGWAASPRERTLVVERHAHPTPSSGFGTHPWSPLAAPL